MAQLPRKRGVDFYRIALTGRRDKGPDDFRGVRSYANGFSPADGYDLHHFAEWTPAQKAKLTRYFNATMELTSRAHKVIRARNPKNLKAIQQASQHPERSPALKVAFLPVQSEAPIRIKVTKAGKVIVKGQYWDRELINFDKKKLVRDPDREIARAIDMAPKAARFTIQAGLYEIPNSYDSKLIGGAVLRLMAKYDGKRITDPRKNPRDHHHKKWLNGLVAYRFPTEKDEFPYMREKEHARTEHHKARRRQMSAFERELWDPLGYEEYIKAGGTLPGMPKWEDISQRMRDGYVMDAKQKHARRKRRK